ncbi:ATP-binding protein [Maridesulfovibrio sp.]|uniref:ATP-binding protein n=1 Tax=Maridesulfovibrio sp. TaxID=2795000 RepID=UPI002A18A4C1|nr:ATP-binding protein [Maridesulfovibrio sp.]
MTTESKKNVREKGITDNSRYKLFLISALILFTGLVGIALWSGYNSQLQLQNTAEKLFAGESAKRAMAVSFFFSGRKTELKKLAADKAIKELIVESDNSSPEKEISAELINKVCDDFARTLNESMVGNEQVFSRIGLLDQTGRLIIDTDSDCLLLRGYSGYEQFAAKNQPVFSCGESAGVLNMVTSVPVRVADGRSGSVVGWIRIESMHRSLENMTLSPSIGSDFLRIGDAVVAISTSSARESGNFLLMDALQDWQGMTVLEAEDQDHDYLAISSPVQGTSTSIISLVEEDRLFGSLSMRSHLLIAIFIFIAISLGCFLLIRTILRRQIFETKAHEASLRETEINAQKEKLEEEIQNRRLADALRKRAEIRYREIFDNAPVGIFQTTLEGRYITANAALAHILGYENQQDLIKAVNDVRTEVYTNPEDWYGGISFLKASGQVSAFEVECKRKDGTSVWTSRDFRMVSGAPGFPAYLEGFVVDITGRRLAEAESEKNQKRLRSLFDNSPVALWELDLSQVKTFFDSHSDGTPEDIRGKILPDMGRVVECVELIKVIDSNNLAIQILTSRDGKVNIDNGFAPYVTEQGWRFFRTVFLDFASGLTKHRSEIQLVRDDGKTQFLIINCNIVPGHEDSWGMVLSTVEDISELKRVENELRISREQAQKANEAKGHFLANMSHEFRTPMNAIKGMVQLLQHSELTPEQQDNLRLIKSSVDSLLIIVNDILDFSKLDSVHMELSEEDLDLPAFLKEMRDIMDIGATNKKIELLLETADIPQCVRMDSLRLRQILTNLLGNAIKFTDTGRVMLRCAGSGKTDSSGKVEIRFEVADTGIGLPESEVESLFKSFVQADPSISRKYGGTGLGLAICSRLVKLMGGELTARNNEEGGASFSFVLQLRECSPALEAADENTPVEEAPAQDISGVKVLVAEDSRMNQILLRKIFEKNGITDYLIVENGKDCVDAFTASDDFDIIFMDIQMPVMDGFEAASAIRKLHYPVRIVALSANAGKEFREKCMESGMDARIVKPFNVEDLLAELALAAKNKA